jgi:thiol-disulfide isomerase/thioredoxin
MKPAESTQAGWRQLAIALVAVGILIILSSKVFTRSGPTAGFVVAETQAEAAVPTLATRPPDASTESSVATQEADPFPQHAADQVEWAMRSHSPAIILFHSTTCKPCKLMEETVKKVRPDFEAQIAFIDVVVSDGSNADLLRQAQIRAIPTTIFLTISGDSYGFIGAMEEEALRAELARLVSAGS